MEDHVPERNTVAQCYEQVLKDLNDALGGLTKEKHDAYMNYWSVKALLSRVYLYMNDNENALKCAEEVINDNGGIYRHFLLMTNILLYGEKTLTLSLCLNSILRCLNLQAVREEKGRRWCMPIM